LFCTCGAASCFAPAVRHLVLHLRCGLCLRLGRRTALQGLPGPVPGQGEPRPSPWTRGSACEPHWFAGFQRSRALGSFDRRVQGPLRPEATLKNFLTVRRGGAPPPGHPCPSAAPFTQRSPAKPRGKKARATTTPPLRGTPPWEGNSTRGQRQFPSFGGVAGEAGRGGPAHVTAISEASGGGKDEGPLVRRPQAKERSTQGKN